MRDLSKHKLTVTHHSINVHGPLTRSGGGGGGGRKTFPAPAQPAIVRIWQDLLTKCQWRAQCFNVTASHCIKAYAFNIIYLFHFHYSGWCMRARWTLTSTWCTVPIIFTRISLHYCDVIMSAMAFQSPASRFLLMCLFGRTTKKTSKLRLTPLCEGTHQWTVVSSHKGPLHGRCCHSITSWTAM